MQQNGLTPQPDMIDVVNNHRVIECIGAQFDKEARRRVCEEINGSDCFCGYHQQSDTGNKPPRVLLTESEDTRVNVLILCSWSKWYSHQELSNHYT